MPRRASKPSAFPAPPRLPPTHVLRRLDAAVLEDEAGYTDVDIAAPVQGRAAKKVTIERATLRDLDLTATRLDTLKLSDVRLVSCDLANAVWREATLTRVELIGCRVTGLDLTEANASDLVVRDCSGALACFRFATIKRALFERCGLSEVDFQDATLGDTRLRGCDLTGAVWFGAKLAGADLRGSTLDELKMRAGDLAGAVIDPVQLVALARTLATLSGIVVQPTADDPE